MMLKFKGVCFLIAIYDNGEKIDYWRSNVYEDSKLIPQVIQGVLSHQKVYELGAYNLIDEDFIRLALRQERWTINGKEYRIELMNLRGE